MELSPESATESDGLERHSSVSPSPITRSSSFDITAAPLRTPREESHRRWLRIAFSIAGAVIITFVIVDAVTAKRLETACAHFVEWVALHPVSGVLAVILVYIVATVCFVPGSVLTVGTGYAFGRAFESTFLAVVLASTAVFIGASLGSLSCLFLGRYLFREPVMRLAEHYPVFRAIDRALEGNGFKIMLLLRLSPLIPYNALDYISGVTSISVKHYTMALLGLLPGATTLCYVGATASSLADGTATAAGTNDSSRVLRMVVMVAGLAFALAGGALMSYYSKIELDKILQQEREQQQQQQALMVASDERGVFRGASPYQEIQQTLDHHLT